MSSELAFIEINPDSEVKSVVIWLHGLGDSGHGFAPIVPELNLDDALGIKFIFPHAPTRPVTINNGMEMRAWYDIKSMELDKRADEAGVIESCELVGQLIDKQLQAGIPAKNIIIAGFSQGGVVALHLATRSKHKFAGLMAMSCYMCEPQKLAAEHNKDNVDMPIFMMHGRSDEVVPIQAGQAAKVSLEGCSYNVQWQDFPMQHNVCVEQIGMIAEWITKRLSH